MELFGEVTPDRPLLVVALHLEGEHLHDLGLPVLVTGPGKLRAAGATARLLAERRPSEVVNLGTAAALRDGLSGIHTIGRAIQHDFDGEAIFELTGEQFGPPLNLGDGPVLATGDRFVADSRLRSQLAEIADFADMEGYAVASVANAAGVPVRLVKQVSDDGDEQAATSWSESVAECSSRLADWVRLQLPA
ncbi:MAG: nucleoside phosphorylase [Actinobacteria bacterium]|uniref:Unannotated protein n=1 Tax=freshwater metagenome TaxID=449393 RepID=A0A6J5YZI1_9ZZZZ|nr:nucleoside phosphorylase [Actinomycetota bacterium]